MSMFCFQCQEAAKNTGCTVKGVCGKDERTSDLMDLLIYVLRGQAFYAEKTEGTLDRKHGIFMTQALFATITNANFDEDRIVDLIQKGIVLRDGLKAKANISGDVLDAAGWTSDDKEEMVVKAKEVSPLSYSENEDLRSLKSLLLYGLKGLGAYADHAHELGMHNDDIYVFVVKALAAIDKDLGADELTGLVLEAGEVSVNTMALLDEANTSKYGHPELTKVNLGVGTKPGILISGHDLRDMEDLYADIDPPSTPCFALDDLCIFERSCR